MGAAADLSGILHAKAREDFYTFAQLAFLHVESADFQDNWHIAAVAHEFDLVARGHRPRLIVSMPPRSLKSYVSSICFPAWLLGRDPSTKVICASYSQPLADHFAYETRRLMETDFYKSVFPKTRIDPGKSAIADIGTTAGGFRMATSVGGALTGRGGDYIIIDDPMKASDAQSETMRQNAKDWFNSTVSSRLNDPKTGAIIMVAQRLHLADLSGHLLETNGWHELCLPMIEFKKRRVELLPGKFITREPGQLLHEARIGQLELGRIRAEMGERDFEAQYNQRPIPPGGALFKLQWLKRYEKALQLNAYEGVFQSWDTAYQLGETNDYSVCTTWGLIGKQHHLLDVYRARLPFNELEKKVRELRKTWNAGLVIVEGIGAGISLRQNIAGALPGHWLQTLKPESSKQDRASQQTPKFERGEVYLPEEAPWLATFETELLSFPHDKHDDQVDSMVQYLKSFDLGRLLIFADAARRYA